MQDDSAMGMELLTVIAVAFKEDRKPSEVSSALVCHSPLAHRRAESREPEEGASRPSD